MQNVAAEIRGDLEFTGQQLLAAEVECKGRKAVLYPGENVEAFLQLVAAWEYNPGFGSQELYGTLWFTDGTWADRREYDGSEWWEGHSRPPLPSR
jgi:hypothetical protein